MDFKGHWEKNLSEQPKMLDLGWCTYTSSSPSSPYRDTSHLPFERLTDPFLNCKFSYYTLTSNTWVILSS